MQQQWADYRVFWREFRQAYHNTGAVLPSGPALSAALARYVREGDRGGCVAEGNGHVIPHGRRILEVGPGTGAVTGRILRHIGPDDQLVLVERNEQFVSRLRARLTEDRLFRDAAERITVVHRSIEDLLDDEPYDLIISGLPLNNFPVAVVEQILAQLQRLIAPQGTLSFFEYVAVRRAKALISGRAERQRLRGVGRALDRMLRAHEIERDLVMANVPPAWVHHLRFG